LLDLPAVAERLGVYHRNVRSLVAEGRIPCLKRDTSSASTPKPSKPGSSTADGDGDRRHHLTRMDLDDRESTAGASR